jgi:hypothetical protein
MPEELEREIRKLEVRLEGFLREEGVFVECLKKCLDKFRELNKNLETLKTKAGLEEVEELVNLRLEAIKSLSDALKKGSEAEHEKSHLLESYEALILALDREFKDILSRS